MKMIPLFEDKSGKLSDKDKENILKDFEEWSGGFHPKEVHWETSEDDKENDDFGIDIYLENINAETFGVELSVIEDWFREIT